MINQLAERSNKSKTLQSHTEIQLYGTMNGTIASVDGLQQSHKESFLQLLRT